MHTKGRHPLCAEIIRNTVARWRKILVSVRDSDALAINETSQSAAILVCWTFRLRGFGQRSL
jgi:hypothetical protein